MTPSSNDPAEARKRRKEIIQSQRSENESIANGATAQTSTAISTTTDAMVLKNYLDEAPQGEASNIATNDPTGNGADKKPPKKRKLTSGDPSSRKNGKKDTICASKSKKTQIRYDPDVPMNKDQLAAWRREARRVRNRESAAASRQRIRNRISELEDEVGEWKAKYSVALQRLEALEHHIAANGSSDNGGASPGEQQVSEAPLEQQAPEAPQEQQAPESPQEQHPPSEQPSEQPPVASEASAQGAQDSTLGP
mmetsp:Transcript_22453/g.53002  ORF Transcript_22453/g.53002 Transcript_22453/m.53002 type:complete len:252 (+) Transcript_22453:190-945(+)|eukprot:CAMPEP_0172373736 /NCGR_PEP_ID=MMETSP1060-20121228/53039_1 /TAXON_ID=37318 /ORGANISM="Pseudo-nitzschia pungens, Strain cf. cingulata" /LENGTH=251 /DNA_ID=CAMNT_0013100157 /DNA_START=154 /DNA_END=909 /DNA_ORIENTATION=-